MSQMNNTRGRREPIKRDMYYVDGSTVRKLDTVPKRQDREYEEREKRQVRKPSAKVIYESEKALAFNLKYTVFLGLSLVIMIGTCVNMLRLDAKINSQKSNISAMETELEQLQDSNYATQNSLNSKYNLDEIYNVATTELGMVYAKKGQIVYYDSANEDYVKQYQNVPGVE